MVALDPALADGDGGRLAPIGGAQLAQDVADVVLGGLGADEQPLGDLGIGQPLGEEAEDFLFPPGQIEADGDTATRRDPVGRHRLRQRHRRAVREGRDGLTQSLCR
jgi:hypothetical protein